MKICNFDCRSGLFARIPAAIGGYPLSAQGSVKECCCGSPLCDDSPAKWWSHPRSREEHREDFI